MAKRLVRVSDEPEHWLDPEKIVMAKAATNTAKHELTRLYVEGMGSTGVTVKGRPEDVLRWLAAGCTDSPYVEQVL